MADGSFGRAYASFMDVRGFQADERPPVRFVDDHELAYVATRYRELHDLWHVLFGCPTTLSGEIALKAVEYLQVGTPRSSESVCCWVALPEVQQRSDRQFLLVTLPKYGNLYISNILLLYVATSKQCNAA